MNESDHEEKTAIIAGAIFYTVLGALAIIVISLSAFAEDPLRIRVAYATVGIILVVVLLVLFTRSELFKYLYSKDPDYEDHCFDGWSPKSVERYCKQIEECLKSAGDDEEKIVRRAGMLLTLDGVIIAFIVAFLFQYCTDDTAKYLVAASLILLLAACFAIWTIYPEDKYYINHKSHLEDYEVACEDPELLEKKILNDLVGSTESQLFVAKFKKHRLKATLIMNMIALATMLSGFIIQLFS